MDRRSLCHSFARGTRLALALAAVLWTSSACTPSTEFSAFNARRHLVALSETFGSRPIGTAANASARAYLVAELEATGFNVRLQDVDVTEPASGLTAHVFNIVATTDGASSDALGLLAHYDSVPHGPGAGDDAFGAAVVLEAARVLAARSNQNHGLMVVLTDGEESGLLGAMALVEDESVTGSLRAYANVESIGADGPAFLFETGPRNGALLRAWSRNVPHPRGASFALEIYRRLPQDTDFSVLNEAGVPGLNFALVGESHVYHTARDTADRIPDSALQRTGDNLVALMGALDRLDLSQPMPDKERYFDVAGVTAVAYGHTTGRIVFVIAFLLGAFAWWGVAMRTLMLLGMGRVLLTLVWTLIGATMIVGAMVGVTWMLRATREVYHPWYAHPNRLLFLLVSTAALAGWLITWIGARSRWRGSAHPALIWCLTLPVWLCTAGVMEWLAPVSSFLWTVPVLASSAALLAFSGWRPQAFGAASIVALAVTGVLWLRDTHLLFEFLVAVLARQPIVTPAWIYPAFLTTAGIMLVPPLIMMGGVIGYERALFTRPIFTRAPMVAFSIALGLAYVAPAYTEPRPLRRQVRYVQHEATGQAFWDVGSNESSLGVTTDAERFEWQAMPMPLSFEPPIAPLRHPFTFRAPAAATAPLPAALSATLASDDDGVHLEIAVDPTAAGLTASFVMPEGTLPIAASLPGVATAGSGWQATYLPVPTNGFTFTATFSEIAELSVRQAVVVLRTFRLPGGTGPQHLPSWLEQQRSVWAASAVYIVPIGGILERAVE